MPVQSFPLFAVLRVSQHLKHNFEKYHYFLTSGLVPLNILHIKCGTNKLIWSLIVSLNRVNYYDNIGPSVTNQAKMKFLSREATV